MGRQKVLNQVTIEEHKLWALLHQTYDSISRCEKLTAQETPITNQQLFVLWTMKFISELTDRPIIITELVPYLNRSLASISAMIYRMEKKDLVKTTRDLPDRRSIRINITSKGNKLYPEAIKPNRDLIKKLLSVYSEEEIQTLILLLTKLKTKANEECNPETDKANPVLDDDAKILSLLNDEGNR